ncbi:MAG: asparagine--tRNA ligase, partial [Proteobacteria bacterium]|nr:asparagine--tRNA ligase [Pseudomonadota bacterium]
MNESKVRPWVMIKRVGDHVGREVTLKGWLYSKRSSGKIRFLVVRDGSGLIQVVMSRGEIPAEVFDLYDQLTQESSLAVTGRVCEEPRAPGGFELSLTGMELIQQ